MASGQSRFRSAFPRCLGGNNQSIHSFPRLKPPLSKPPTYDHAAPAAAEYGLIPAVQHCPASLASQQNGPRGTATSTTTLPSTNLLNISGSQIRTIFNQGVPQNAVIVYIIHQKGSSL